MAGKLKKFLRDFLALEIVPGKKVRLPYWRNKRLVGGRWQQGPEGGKGTPAQLRRITLEKARQAGLDLTKMKASQIRKFMRQKRIGLDCSGFAFQVLQFLFPGFWRGLKKAPGRSKNPRRRFNAAALTSPANTVRVDKVENILPGDLIPFSFKGKKIDHVAVVVEKRPKQIIYAHSSQKTKVEGVHLGKIKIISSGQNLAEQEWEEKIKTGESLKKFALQPLKERGVRRIKYGAGKKE